ncbi:MAG: DUF5050 domain-containing protein [Roseburia sp.]|nr:DUF5050 domain-containing protein [Roseburia sp.]
MQNKKNLLYATGILIAAVTALTLLAVYHFLERIPQNPPDTVGNTAGNINNSGLFCEHRDTVYFSNSFDGGCLYAMDPTEGNIRKISDVIICNLLAGGDYLYYFQLGSNNADNFAAVVSDRGFNRNSLTGKNQSGLTRDVITSAQLVGNYLYLLASTNDGPLFYKMKTDRSDKTDLANYPINPACALNGVIYYSDARENHALFALDTSDDVLSTVYNGTLWNPVIYEDYVYYMDVANNYRLCRYSLSEEQEEVLTDDRVDCFNIGSGYIYYQKNGADAQLKCMRMDGTDETVIAQGNYTHINMTSQYVYFQEFGNDTTMYHSAIGSAGYELFAAAREAAPNSQEEEAAP